MESILNSIKKLLGIQEEFEEFDSDIIMHINSVVSGLSQIGLEYNCNFFLTNSSQKWEEILGNAKNIEFVKTYIYLKVKLLFDIPANSFTIEAINKQIAEIEWRISISKDLKEEAENYAKQ